MTLDDNTTRLLEVMHASTQVFGLRWGSVPVTNEDLNLGPRRVFLGTFFRKRTVSFDARFRVARGI